jgi:hypothetical protein
MANVSASPHSIFGPAIWALNIRPSRVTVENEPLLFAKRPLLDASNHFRADPPMLDQRFIVLFGLLCTNGMQAER